MKSDLFFIAFNAVGIFLNGTTVGQGAHSAPLAAVVALFQLALILALAGVIRAKAARG